MGSADRVGWCGLRAFDCDFSLSRLVDQRQYWLARRARERCHSGILETIKAVLEAAGGSLKDVTFNQIFLSDMGGYAVMNEVYREYFRENPPARYCIRVDLVRPEFLVEIASVAHLEQ